MEINDLMDEILLQSAYEGRFTLDELLHHSSVHPPTGIAVSKEKTHAFFLLLLGGEPDGAIFVDERGTLFGDAAALHLSGNEEFELFQVMPQIVDALVSRCRVFEKSHLKKNGRLDIPTIGAPTRQRIGVLCLTVRDNSGTPLAGAQVSIRKGKVVMTSDVTDSGGKVCFRLLNGRYMCVVSDRTGERTRCIIEFHEPQVESCVDIGGIEDESE
ncbi:MULTISPECIES: carboxypeptidase-like regulatory domain-containing protein [unclassified Methanoculleus]|nr:carboxypeptidase-like regulatory domain-containing protein [Methanoculleus sp. UBA377]MDD2472370.1 carboxypeptidase-like regulatory domain-containing protein [Methanoculleus sp.]